MCKIAFLRFIPQTVSTLRGSYGKGKGRCLIEVFNLFLRLIPQTVSTLRGSYGKGKGRCLIKVFNLFSIFFL